MPTFNSTNSSGASCNTGDNKNASFNSIIGRWIVPNAISLDDNANYNLVTWIGLGQGVIDEDFGIVADYIFQIEIIYEGNENNPLGFVGYRPFFLAPYDYSYRQVVNFEVSAGDAIFAMICNIGPEIFFGLTNETTSQYTSWSYNQKEANLYFNPNWAAWIVGKTNLNIGDPVIAKYGAVIFDDAGTYLNGIGNILPNNPFSLNDYDSGGVFGTLLRGRICSQKSM